MRGTDPLEVWRVSHLASDQPRLRALMTLCLRSCASCGVLEKRRATRFRTTPTASRSPAYAAIQKGLSSKIFIASSRRISVLPFAYNAVKRQSVTNTMPEVGPAVVSGHAPAIAMVIFGRYHG